MNLQTRRPSPPLEGLVNTFWHLESDPSPHAAERALPEGTVELVIDLREGAEAGSESTLVGPHTEYFLLATDSPVEVVGAHFAAGGAFRFLDLPADELLNRSIRPEDLWGASACAELVERLLESRDEQARMQELERFLLARVASRWEPHPAVGWALEQFDHVPHACTVAEVTAAVGLSSTRLTDLFRREVGTTPKLYCRLRRFQAALRRIEACAPDKPQWADLAYACGYSDQAHLVREFRHFAGYTPTEYLAHRTGKLNHLRDADRG